MLELQKLREQRLNFALQMIEYSPTPSYAKGGMFGTHQEGGGESFRRSPSSANESDESSDKEYLTFLQDMLELQKLREQRLNFALQMIKFSPPPSYAKG
jgi:hypothetical protein